MVSAVGFLLMASGMVLGSDVQESLDAMTVMTFNIRYGTANDGENVWPNRKEMVFEVIKKHDPDVLGLQEALKFQIDEILAACPEYRSFGIGRTDGLEDGEYAPILYKPSAMGIIEAGTKWISESPDEVGSMGPGANIPRIFTWIKFQPKGGKPFLAMNAHFDHQSPAARLMGAEQMVAFPKRFPGLPTVMMGDLNCSFEDDPIKAILAGGYQSVKPKEGPWGSFTGFKYGQVNGTMIDHIFFDSNWTLESSEIDRFSRNEKYPSDHFPVIARLRR